MNFEQWIKQAYGVDANDSNAKFTVYNMEVAYAAGKTKTPEELWDSFIESVHKDARLSDDLGVVNLIGGVKKYRKLFLDSVKETK